MSDKSTDTAESINPTETTEPINPEASGSAKDPGSIEESPEQTFNNPIVTDPVIQFLASLKFDQDVFAQLHSVSQDPEQYDKYFRVPELFVFLNAHYVLSDNDPNKGNMDHQAMQNLLQWITIKMASDPVWLCYLGWFLRFVAVHTDPTSYWPIKFTPRFLPKNFIKRGEPVDIGEENAKIKTPEEVFKIRKSK